MKLLHGVCCGIVVVGREVLSLYLHGTIRYVPTVTWMGTTRDSPPCRVQMPYLEVVAPMIAKHQIKKVSNRFALKQKCVE